MMKKVERFRYDKKGGKNEMRLESWIDLDMIRKVERLRYD